MHGRTAPYGAPRELAVVVHPGVLALDYPVHAVLNRTRHLIGELGYTADPELWGPPTDELAASVAAKCQRAPDCTIVVTPKPKPKPSAG